MPDIIKDTKAVKQQAEEPVTPETSTMLGQQLSEKLHIDIKQPPIQWDQTQHSIQQLESKLNGKVIVYYTSSSIVGDDVKYFYAHLRDIGFQDTLYFVLVSSGGDGKSAYRIASLLRNYCNKLVIIVPEMCASAATMLTLSADEIRMTPLAYLTAVDTSIIHPLNPRDADNKPVKVELEEVKRALGVLISNSDPEDKADIYKTVFNYIHPVAFGSMERTSTLSEMICYDALELRKEPLSKAATKKLIKKLNREYPSHSYPITRNKARELGLNVVDTDEELDKMLGQLLSTYRFMTEPVRTELTDSFFHTEKFLNIIESTTKRFVVSQITERRIDPIVKGWTTLKDEFKWLFMQKNAKDQEIKISHIDY
jgi:hypothetical protein